MNDVLIGLVLALAVLNTLVLVWLATRRGQDAGAAVNEQARIELLQVLQATAKTNLEKLEAVERELRREMTESSRSGRQELTQNLATFQLALVQQGAEATRTQNTQIDAFGQQLATLQKTLSDTLNLQLSGLSESNARRMNEVRETLEKQLLQLQTNNAVKLDEMRATVDEKLQATLQARLGESFKQVSHQLEQVHKGLGEMQTLAQGVGDLKHLLTNVKTRGILAKLSWPVCWSRCL